jgi:hypothetical protein
VGVGEVDGVGATGVAMTAIVRLNTPPRRSLQVIITRRFGPALLNHDRLSTPLGTVTREEIL